METDGFSRWCPHEGCFLFSSFQAPEEKVGGPLKRGFQGRAAVELGNAFFIYLGAYSILWIGTDDDFYLSFVLRALGAGAAASISLPRCTSENALIEVWFSDIHNWRGLLFSLFFSFGLCSWGPNDVIESWGIEWGLEAAVATGNKASLLREHTAPKCFMGVEVDPEWQLSSTQIFLCVHRGQAVLWVMTVA